MRHLWLLALGVFGTAEVARGDDSVAWPVPKAGMRVIHRMHFEMGAEVGGTPSPPASTLRGDLEQAQEALESLTGGIPDIRVTVGRMHGTTPDVEETGVILAMPFYEDLAEVGELLRATFAPAAPGSRLVRRPGAPPAQRPSDDGTGERPPPRPALSDLLLPITPPPIAVKVGTTWDSTLTLTSLDSQWGSRSARNEVIAIDGTSITWSSRVDVTASPTPGPGAIRLKVVLERRISREDGLSLEGSLDMLADVTGGPPQGARTKCRWERIGAAVAPPGVAAAESAMRDLAGGDATARAAAATALAAIWPYGARAVPTLVAALADDDGGVRAAASAALTRLVARALDVAIPFLAALEKGEPSGFTPIVEVCLALGAAVTPTDLAAGISAGAFGGPLAAALLAPLWGASTALTPYTLFLPIIDHAAYRVVDGLEIRDPGALEMASAALALAAIEALPAGAGRTPPKSILDLLRRPQPATRWAAAKLLDRFGSGTEEVLGALRAARAAEPPHTAESHDRGMHVNALPAIESALERLDPSLAQHELAALRTRLADPAERDRWSVAIELSRAGVVEAKATAILLEAFAAKPKQERWVETVEALGRVGAAARPALDTIDRYLGRFPAGSPGPYIAAAVAACRIDGPTALRVEVLLASLLKPEPVKGGRLPYPGQRTEAEGRTLEAARGVVELLPRMEASVQAKAAVALSGALEWSTDRRTREEILSGLPRAGANAAGSTSDLLAALRRQVDAMDVRPPGQTSEGLVDHVTLLKALGAVYEQAWRERFQLIDALGGIGGGAKEALAILDPLGADEDRLLGYIAVRAARRIRGS